MTQSRLAVPVPKAPLIFNVGTRVRLFQENDHFYIVAVDDESGAKKLVATPRRKGTTRIAWATPENFLFFAYETECVDGVLYLTAGEELPVLGEEAGLYHVQLQRGPDAVVIKLPKTDPALYFIPNPVAAEKPSSALEPERKPVASATSGKAPPKAVPRTSKDEIVRPSVLPSSETEKLVALLDTNWESSVLSFLVPDEWATSPTLVPEKKPPAWWQRLDFEQTIGVKSSFMEILKSNVQAIVIGILLLVLIVAGTLSGVRQARVRKQQQAQQKAQPPPAPSAPEPAVMLNAPPAPDFSGSLASMSLNAVMQFLNTDKESGKLTLYNEDHSPVAVVYFWEGEIIDAQIGSKTGTEAMYEIMGQKDGHFAFIRSKHQQVPRVIDVPTLSLLLEVNRVLDEQKEKEQAAQPPTAKSPKRKDSSLRLRRHAAH